MCIIAVKRPESAPIQEETLREMFRSNPDGAGIAYATGGRLHIIKGLMDADSFIKAAQKIPSQAAAIYHCRIATSGGKPKELTHPFLIDADIKQQRQIRVETTTGAALAHNGVFHQYANKELNNDTTQFITNNIAPLAALKEKTGGSIIDADIKNVIEELTGNSKIAIITARGELATFGSYWIEDGGIKYSNSTYKKLCYYNPPSFEEWKENAKKAAALKQSSKVFADVCKKYKQYGLTDAEVYELYQEGMLF